MTQNTKDAGASLTRCAECGMHCTPGEFHPYAACLLFRACGNATEVRAHIAALRAPTAEQAEGVQTPYAYEIGERGRTQSLAYPEYLERYATKEERALPRLALYAAPVAPTPEMVPAAWVSVEDRLPDEGQTVAFVVDCKSATFGYLHGRVLGGYFSFVGQMPTFSVPGLGIGASYWMLLPSAPALAATAQSDAEGKS